MAAGLVAGTLVAGAVVTATLVTAAAPAAARAPATPLTSVATGFVPARRASGQVRAADGLTANLVRADEGVAAARLRLRILMVQSRPLLASLKATIRAQVAAQTEATAQSTRLAELGRQVQRARSALQQSAVDSYMGGGGPLGEMAVALQSLTPLASNSWAGPLTTLSYRVNLRTHLFIKAQSEWLAQVTTSARATSASSRATAVAKTSGQAKSAHDALIAGQQRLVARLRAAQNADVSRAAGVRGILLRSGSPAATAADRRLVRVLKGRDYQLLMRQSTRCGKGSPVYSNGWWPATARCPLFAAPGQSLRRTAAMAFNRMSNAYQRQHGYALCVNESYRSYPAQVAIKQLLPRLAAMPGTSNHGLGLALDLCGGVQDFADPAHQWMKHNGPHFGWVQPAWAEPSGGLPEPWHWEFTG